MAKRLLALVLALLLAVAGCSASSQRLLWDRVMALHDQGQWGESVPLLQELLVSQRDSTNTTVAFALAVAYHEDKRVELAIEQYERVLAVEPRHLTALVNLGFLHIEAKDSRVGLDLLQRALAVDPSIEPRIVQYLAVAHQHIGMPHIAEQLLEKVPMEMRTAQYHFDRGVALEKQGKLLDANAAFNDALEMDQNFSLAWHNVAALHQMYGTSEESIRCYMNVLRIESSTKGLKLMAMSNMGAAFETSEDIHSALHWYDAALKMTYEVEFTAPEQPLETRVMLAVHKARAKRTAGMWGDLEPHADALMHLIVHEQLRQGFLPGLPPFDTLLTVVDPLMRLELARQYSLNIVALTQPLIAVIKEPPPPPRDKLCVGYISYDFTDHPTAHLMEGLFATHDTQRQDVVVYGYGRDDKSDFRHRLLNLVDEFVNLAVESVEQSIRTIRSRGIDVLMDAQGHTRGGRSMIIAARPAQIVVNYLVYPGTSGAPYVDYLISDRLVTPPETLAAHFSEKLVLLPHSYQVNYYPEAVVPGGRSTLWSDEPQVAGREVNAEEATVGDDWFTFVNFNKIDKLEPSAFALWMAILRRVPKSRLMLLDPTRSGSKKQSKTSPRRTTKETVKMTTSETIKRNLRLEAAAHGISSERLQFLPRVPKRDHLRRHRHGGLFLDTLVYGAHSTATDALYAGLPVLTLAGDSFASRVGVSLLENVGLPELITHSKREFEDLAVLLATERRPLLDQLRGRLRVSHDNQLLPPLFLTRQHVKTLEEAQHAMATLSRRAQSPSDSMRTAHLIVV